jgi:hypothetical protein
MGEFPTAMWNPGLELDRNREPLAVRWRQLIEVGNLA